ncbi:hypothetical protein LAZ67_6002273 [Cordylochernes scorpioides]|uniref:Uncharacterized protein n=1 Tax=Cordylochernes scorpioides TaxID=51811 RepID=A0ABY6KJQ3_9ARAC|nr:hypothetical protein LAZ67_6002273 [Cordylochernes scorpioides]
MPLDLQAWLFGVGLHPEGMKITSVAKATIYKYHLGLEVGNARTFLLFRIGPKTTGGGGIGQERGVFLSALNTNEEYYGGPPPYL